MATGTICARQLQHSQPNQRSVKWLTGVTVDCPDGHVRPLPRIGPLSRSRNDPGRRSFAGIGAVAQTARDYAFVFDRTVKGRSKHHGYAAMTTGVPACGQYPLDCRDCAPNSGA